MFPPFQRRLVSLVSLIRSNWTRNYINNVNDLRRVFKDPSNLNADTWFTAANFLGYGGNLKVVRVVNEDTSKNAGDSSGFLIKNEDHYESFASTDGIAAASVGGNNYVAKYAGGSTQDQSKLYGNSLKVSVSNRTEVGVELIGNQSDGANTNSAADMFRVRVIQHLSSFRFLVELLMQRSIKTCCELVQITEQLLGSHKDLLKSISLALVLQTTPQQSH